MTSTVPIPVTPSQHEHTHTDITNFAIATIIIDTLREAAERLGTVSVLGFTSSVQGETLTSLQQMGNSDPLRFESTVLLHMLAVRVQT